MTHTWLYYAVAVQSVVTPLGYLMAKEQSVATEREVRSIQLGTMLYSSFAVLAFVVFVLRPGFMRIPYGWAIDVPGVQETEKDDPAQRALEEKYLGELDAWVASGPLWEGQKVDDAVVRARIQPALETRRKLLMLTATAEEKAAFAKPVRGEFGEFDLLISARA